MNVERKRRGNPNLKKGTGNPYYLSGKPKENTNKIEKKIFSPKENPKILYDLLKSETKNIHRKSIIGLEAKKKRLEIMCIKKQETWIKEKSEIYIRIKKIDKKINSIKRPTYSWLNEKSPIDRFKGSIRTRISGALKGKKDKLAEEFLGAKIMLVKEFIQRKFKSGMNWDNYGRNGWTIDHIIPLNSAKTTSEMIELLHYTNLQPLWHKENLRKGAKMPKNHQIKMPI